MSLCVRDSDVEIRVTLLGNESVDEHATIRSIAELQAIDVHACLSPMQRSDTRARPDAGVELKLQSVQLKLVSNPVERERCISAVGSLVVLIDNDLQRAIRFVVRELSADAVEIEASRAHSSRLRADAHLRLRRARVDPIVIGGESADGIATRDDVGARCSSFETEVLDVTGRHSVGAQRAGDIILVQRRRCIDHGARQRHPGSGALHFGRSHDARRVRVRSGDSSRQNSRPRSYCARVL